jgi:hypothetical protein
MFAQDRLLNTAQGSESPTRMFLLRTCCVPNFATIVNHNCAMAVQYLFGISNS